MKQGLLGSAAADPLSHLRLWITAGLALPADLLSKWAVWQWLEDAPEQTHHLIDGFLAIKLVHNPGVAFGIELGWWVILSAVIAGIGLVIYLFLSSQKTAGWFHLGLGLILSGALGNLADRFMYPWMVRDFIDFSFWPTFNLADVFLCIGVGLIALGILRSPSDCP